jgi:hypothetical protein
MLRNDVRAEITSFKNQGLFKQNGTILVSFKRNYLIIHSGIMTKGLFLLTGCVLLLFAGLSVQAQGNLVPNPSFESYTACPVNNGTIVQTGNWYNPNGGSTDYFNSCVPANGTFGLPQNYAGSQSAYNNGAAYAGVVACMSAGGPSYREYLQTQLISPLMAGQTYYLSFYVSAAEIDGVVTADFGAYLSATALSQVTPFNFTVTPQVANPPGQFLNDTLNWTLISGSYVAAGGEQYITIGNFKDDASTSRDTVDFSNPYICYYYIDEVCLSLNPQTCANVGVGIRQQSGNGASCYYRVASKHLIFEEPAPGCTVIINDLSGRPVKTLSTEAGPELDLSDLPAGCYLIYVSKGQQKTVQKVLIQ